MPFSSIDLFRRGSIVAAIWAIVLIATPAARAGGGPENLFLVVNSRSWSSLTVANHYARLRKIPISNVLYLDWPFDNERVDAETMRSKLLGPIMEEIGRRGVGDHIDYIVYSTDFPWQVDCTAETKGANLSQYLAPYASLSGLTFFSQKFLARQYELLLFDANKYYRTVPRVGPPATQGFHAWYGWGKDGRLLEAGGERYYLSTVLGITSGRGMATSDVVRNLTRSVGADYTRPSGSIYYVQNEDVRSKTRHDAYLAAAAALKPLGVKGEVVSGILPQGKSDVMGAMIGAEQFSWRSSQSTVRPGAICEHLTSTGGVMSAGAGQTPLTENLAAGAAGSSGAVAEPFAIPQKFPNPFIHVHYARGCSLAEAYYQSVSGPYQLLIVGDPLCRPWADPPRVSVEGVDENAVVQGDVTLRPTAKVPFGSFVARYELYIDGVFNDACESGETITVETRMLVDGYHELRMMAVCTEPIETRGGLLVPINVANRGQSLVLERVDVGPVQWDQALKLRVKADDAVGIVVAQGSRTLARIRGNQAEFSLNPRTLGLGPVTLQAASLGRAGAATNLMSVPLEIDVAANAPTSFSVPPGAQFKAGMKLTQSEGEPQVVLQIAADTWLKEFGIVPGESFSLSGLFSVDRDGEYQYQLHHQMQATLLVDDVPIYEVDNKEYVIDYIPVSLKHGLHKVELRGKAGEDRRFDIRFGYAGMQRISPAAMTYIP